MVYQCVPIISSPQVYISSELVTQQHYNFYFTGD